MNKKEMGFEEALEKLDDVVKRLELGTESLDKSLELFEDGIALIKLCNEKLDKAEQKIRILTENSDGTVSDAPFDKLENEA